MLNKLDERLTEMLFQMPHTRVMRILIPVILMYVIPFSMITMAGMVSQSIKPIYSFRQCEIYTMVIFACGVVEGMLVYWLRSQR